MAPSNAARRVAPSTGSQHMKIHNTTKNNKEDDDKSIVFSSPGLTPDVRLTVFGQEFHVHSIILKLHSNFFRKFLDAGDKAATPPSSLFQYDYVSVSDDDGTWGLEPTSSKSTSASKNNSDSFFPVPELEIWSFRKLLCSMYTRPYVIEDVTDLLTIIHLADYYCSLPNLSGTISTALLGSPMFKKRSISGESEREEPESEVDTSEEKEPSEFVQRAGEIFLAAKKLRHPILFRESFIHLVARLHDDKFYSSYLPALRDDKDLWLLLNEGKSRLRRMILQAQHEVMVGVINGDLSTDDETMARQDESDNPDESALFFRKVLGLRESIEMLHGKHWVQEFYSPINALMRNNLALDQTGFLPGQGPYECCFLCANLADKDMPWNATDFDW